jgi:hypothetical protein
MVRTEPADLSPCRAARRHPSGSWREMNADGPLEEVMRDR